MIRRTGTLVGFLLIVAFFASQRPNTFLTLRNWLNIAEQMSILGVVAFTSTVVMVVGDFDLSVGSMASLSGIIAAALVQAEQPLALALAVALTAGLMGGLFNGVIVSYVRITPFVATLGTLTMYAGMALLVSDGTTIFGRAIGDAFGAFASSGIPVGTVNERLVTLSNLTLLSLGVFAVIWVVLEQTVFGRRLYALGGNYEAARLSGIRVRVLRLLAFAFSGLGAAIAGLMLVSRLETANPTQGSGLMLQAIAAVFLGMTMSEEGEPHVAGTLLGVFILGVLANGLRLMAVDSYIQQVLTGFIILLAVSISSLSRRGG
jgi:ribose transport system permease protein